MISKVQESLLNALDIATAEFGSNSAFVVKFRVMIGQHFPNIKDTAFRTASTSGVVKTGFGGRTPILPKRQNISATVPPSNAAAKSEPKREAVIPTKQEEIAADANEHVINTEFDLTELSTKTEREILDSLGRPAVQELAVKLGFAIDSKKSDMAYVTNFKKALLKATEVND